MKLTKTEEEIMNLIWRLEECTVSQIIELIGEPRPPHSTISSVVRILEKKGFVKHKAYGRTYVYKPAIDKEDYSKRSLKQMAKDYFQGSWKEMVSFLVKEEEINIKDLESLISELDQKENK